MKTYQETKIDYVTTFENTKIKHNKIKEKFIVNLHFVNGPWLEILGNMSGDFLVNFIDKKNNEVVHSTILTTNMWTKVNRQYFTDWQIQIIKDNKIIYKYDLNFTKQRILISFDSKSIGDNIAWFPYVEEFRKQHDCEVIVSTFWNQLFKAKYPKLQFVEPGTLVPNLHAMFSGGWFYNEDIEPEAPNTIPLQKSMTNVLGLEYKEIKPEIDFTPLKRPYSKRYVVIAPHSTAKLKYWNNDKGWEELISYLIDNDYQVINISKEGCDFDGVKSIKDFSIENTMNVIHHSEFYIGLSSGLSWLSWALDKHVVMISNFSKKDHEFTSNCTRIVNESVCHGCWNSDKFRFDKGDWNWCPILKGTNRQFECHKSITSEMVINQIQHLIKKPLDI